MSKQAMIMNALREALKELREEQEISFSNPRDEKFALGYLYKSVMLALGKVSGLRSIPDCPTLSVRRVNKLEKHAQSYANYFATSFRAGGQFTSIVTESMIPNMCAGMCEATFARSRDKKIVAEQIKYVRACAEHWCKVFLKMTSNNNV